MTLDALFAACGATAPRIPVRGITHDSRRVRSGFVFVAIRGRRHDGHAYAAEAVLRGAVAVVGDRPLTVPVPYLRVPDARRALSRLAATYHGDPSRDLRVIGVTGTKGKTTTCYLIEHVLRTHGRDVGMLSTLGVCLQGRPVIPRDHYTTPEAPQVQESLAEMVRRGLEYAVIETSSHALALHRVADIDYRLAVWTHLHAEHLDFHGDMEAYFRAKAELISRAPLAVLNVDCPYAMRLSRRPHISYGLGRGDFRARRVHETPCSVAFRLDAPRYAGRVRLLGIGRFNVHNALAAIAAAYAEGIEPGDAVEAIAAFHGVPGRMQVVLTAPVRVVVDFAHTPPSLAAAIDALLRGGGGRLIVVTGAAGDRDPRKRAPIGRLAVERADLAVFTEEDFRYEQLGDILRSIVDGARTAGGREGRDFLVIPDRRRAIRHALSAARPGDTLLVTGKGHERFLQRGEQALAWSDVSEVQRAWRELRRPPGHDNPEPVERLGSDGERRQR